MPTNRERKEEYVKKLNNLFTTYSKILIVGADNVGSNHMQNIRVSIRGKGVLLMGKNTMVRRVIRTDHPEFESLLPYLQGNVGLLFTEGDFDELKEIIVNNRVGAPAKAGSIAPCSVTVPAGDTGLEPTQTAFLQALNIASKINRGQIQILKEVQLVTEGEKVGASQATLLQKLKIRPFSYGLVLKGVYEDGSVFDASVLDINFDLITQKISMAASNIACIALEIGFPVKSSVPHSMARAFKTLLSLAVATEINFERAQSTKDLLNMDPEALAAMVAASSSAAAPAAEAAPAPVVDDDDSDDDDMEFGLFD